MYAIFQVHPFRHRWHILEDDEMIKSWDAVEESKAEILRMNSIEKRNFEKLQNENLLKLANVTS